MCNGSDDDCDGSVDEGLSRACATACGSGVETCNAGSYVGCSAPSPQPETCNSSDDDCDGSVDEGFQVEVFHLALSTLTAEHPACTGSASSISGCMAAASRYCSGHAWGCFRGGAGLLSVSGSSADIVCFGEDSTRLNTNITELSSVRGIPLVAVNLGQRLAQSAVKRYCTNMGFAAGVGPVEYNGTSGDLALICLDAAHAAVVGISTSEMQARGCDPIATPDLPACNYAADAWCRDAGHVAGLGPVEWNTSMTFIECLDDPS